MGRKSTKENKNIYQLTREELDLTRCIFQPNSITVPKGLHAIPLQTAQSAASV